MRGRPLFAVVLGAVVLALVAWLIGPKRAPHDSDVAPPSAPMRAVVPAEPGGPEQKTAAVDPEPEAIDNPGEIDHEPSDHSRSHSDFDPYSDLEFYARRAPMSEVPHTVVRGWGARGGGRVPGLVGVFIVVDPAISDAELERLALDVRDFHHDAHALSVWILDSEHASTYDRHTDGGALAAEHLVATVNRNEALGSDNVQIRDRLLDADELD